MPRGLLVGSFQSGSEAQLGLGLLQYLMAA